MYYVYKKIINNLKLYKKNLDNLNNWIKQLAKNLRIICKNIKHLTINIFYI